MSIFTRVVNDADCDGTHIVSYSAHPVAIPGLSSRSLFNALRGEEVLAVDDTQHSKEYVNWSRCTLCQFRGLYPQPPLTFACEASVFWLELSLYQGSPHSRKSWCSMRPTVPTQRFETGKRVFSSYTALYPGQSTGNQSGARLLDPSAEKTATIQLVFENQGGSCNKYILNA